MSKPPNSFFIFCKLNRDKVRDLNPNRPNAVISAILGEQWRNMSIAEKGKYRDIAMKTKKEFLKTNPVPQRKKKEVDAFTFSFRLKKNTSSNMKLVEKVICSHQTERNYQKATCPPRRKQIIVQPPVQPEIYSSVSSDIDFLESIPTPYYFDSYMNSWISVSSQESMFAPVYYPISRY